MKSRSLVLACITTATFTDLTAYSVAVPVLPDFAMRFHATPTVVGLLFGSFGITLLIASVPMGALSDRLGRKRPMMAALFVLAVSTAIFAYARSLPMLFFARMLQGAADAATWVVGFALITDLYGETERGRAMGLAMGGSTLGIIIGPLVGGWLYEIGGIRLPFLIVAALAAIDMIVFAVVTPATAAAETGAASLWKVVTLRPIAVCALLIVAAAATMAMLEPVMPLVFESRLGLRPASIGTLFGIAGIASSAMHPVYGRLSDRSGARCLMLTGLIGSAAMLPMLNLASDFRSAALVMTATSMMFGMIITPSLAYFAQIASHAGVAAYGVVYGIYNVAWAVGLMAGPAIGGFFLERAGFGRLTVGWSVLLLAAGAILARLR